MSEKAIRIFGILKADTRLSRVQGQVRKARP
nr:MAG TPA: hypothetical protein [Caudoviricetes sp.]